MKIVNILTLLVVLLPIMGILGEFLKLSIQIPMKILVCAGWVAFVLFIRGAMGGFLSRGKSIDGSSSHNNKLDV